MNKDAIGSAVLAACCLAGPLEVHAELQPISDREMGQVQGQAMIAVDRTVGANQQFTRITMGMDSEIQTNLDRMALGEGAAGADLDVEQMALGHISEDAARIQLDGNTYAVGDIVPFEAIDPYFELAESNGEIVGIRVGLNQARGTVSGNIHQFSGNLGLQLDDGSGNVTAATLFDANTQATGYRASHIGLQDAATDCAAGVQCAPLSNLQTLAVGEAQADGSVDYAKDFFLSFQEQAVDWQSLDGSRMIQAGPGVHFNLPTSMTMDLPTLQQGIPRARTEYIDRGMGLF
ncbi:DUF6160 family protein [Marinobacter xestospongiae]|uniref:DUF6160 family protein n=1 Tax=Marinobacter xestospongiae TaxID=994319 RepID=UPI0020050200|nr:DUF6160 family protein [Marinobacter xestospongiae]MCK7568890.1 hypothetical protein [Marinobacter xestospongiae]